MNAGILDKSVISPLKPDFVNNISSDNRTSNNSDFATCLNDALKKVDYLQKEADKGARMLALGEEDYLHNTMIAYEKAHLALQLTIEVRNKIIEAYQEIMRIQM